MRSSPPVRARRVFLLGPAGVPSDSAVQRKRCPSSFSTYPAFAPLQAGPFFFTQRWGRHSAVLFKPGFAPKFSLVIIWPFQRVSPVVLPGPPGVFRLNL